MMSSRDGRPQSADGRLGQLLAQAGEVRGPLHRPAHRLLGREPGGSKEASMGRYSLTGQK
jgi:hypothetical protein